MAKFCKKCGKLNENPLLKLCREHYYQEQSKNTKQLKFKQIKQVSDKRKERLGKYSEKDMFLEIWNEREHICEDCGKYLKEAKAHNFDHIIPKSKGEEHRLDKNNIKLVCFKCHFEKTNGLVYKGIDFDL